MGMPSSVESRRFYRAAQQRFADAEFLFGSDRTTGAVYLAGYGVECMLKALLLALLKGRRQRAMLDSFRGRKAHDFVWLKAEFQKLGHSIPSEVSRQLVRVSSWSTDMRYVPGTIRKREAQAFLDAAAAVIAWADGRI